MSDQDAATRTPSRLVLEGVPRVHFFEGGKRCPEDFPFPSALRACLEYLDDPFVGCNAVRAMARETDQYLGCTYAWNILTSGIAAQQTWHRDNWEWGGQVLCYAPQPTEPFQRAFEAAGYACEIVGNAQAEGDAQVDGRPFARYEDAAALRERIVASIGSGRPVMAFGVIGPPECGIITGYDEGGGVLLGWSYFQSEGDGDPRVSREPSGYYRKRGWQADLAAIITFGERGERPPLRDTLRRALAWNVTLARTPTMRGYHSGLAALDAWAEAVADDTQFDTDDIATLRTRYQIHHGMTGQVAEARWYGGMALAQAAQYHDPVAEHLLAAAGHYAAIHRLMWDIWGCAGGIGEDDDKVRRGTSAAARERIVALIRRTRAEDEQAVACLERALERDAAS